MLRAAGFSGGEVLEPSSGTGVFLHTAPEGAHVSAVEMSPISSRIARILHGPAGHEVATASLERFATQDGRLFDAAIGNPPFGPRGELIRDDKPDIGTAERYFVDTTLDKLRDGGLAALVLPTGVMDSRSGRAFRERILRKAEFLGGQRMPNTAFTASHTGVTTDVLLFRKRPQAAAGALSTLTQDQLRAAGVWDDDFLAGTYFTEGRGTGNVLGSLEPGWRAKAGLGNDITVEGSMDGVPEAIAGFQPEAPVAPTPDMPDILAALGNDPEARERAIAASQRPAYEPARPGDVRVIDGVRYVLQGEPPRWHRADEDLPLAVADAQAIAETLDDLVEGRSKDPAYTRIGLIESLDSYVATHGAPARNRQLREWLANPSMAQQEGVAPEDHPALVREMQRRVARLLGAVRPDGGYSDLVTGPKAQPQRQGSLDALAQQLSIEGGFTADSLARAAGKTREEALDHLFASPDYAIAA
ncbi:MAG: N-6 DNA methylase, partial [Roseomonas mucosa]|nr:N-6 DNA methylase [Roseomonas mucosa]